MILLKEIYVEVEVDLKTLKGKEYFNITITRGQYSVDITQVLSDKVIDDLYRSAQEERSDRIATLNS